MEQQPNVYNLPGGTVEVHQPFGKGTYYALVELDGRYPEEGKIAHDQGRKEYIQLLRGKVILTVNDAEQVLRPDVGILVNDGDYYFVEGKGRLIVFVEDQEGGTTLIEDLQ